MIYHENSIEMDETKMANQPLYKKIYQELKKQIFTGELKEDEQLPTELELSEMYNVSRITSKRAVVELENEGLIYRVRGKGSFVKRRETEQMSTNQETILFIMPFAQNEGFGNYAEGILESFKETPFRLQMQPHEWLTSGNDYTLKKDYAGIIYYPINTQISLDFLYKCQVQEIPVVILDKSIEKIEYDSVVADNHEGGKMSAEYFLDQEIEDVLFISVNRFSDVSSVRDRYLGYLTAMYENEKNPIQLMPKEGDELESFFKTVFEEVNQLTQENKNVGLVVENDVIAIRLMTYLKQQGMEVPKQVGIIGFDNIQAANLMDPPLTTVAQNFYEMGHLAGELLKNQIVNTKNDYSEHVVPVELIERQSAKYQ